MLKLNKKRQFDCEYDDCCIGSNLHHWYGNPKTNGTSLGIIIAGFVVSVAVIIAGIIFGTK